MLVLALANPAFLRLDRDKLNDVVAVCSTAPAASGTPTARPRRIAPAATR